MTQTVAEVVAGNIRRLRTDAGWSQPQLAVRLRQRGLAHWTGTTVAKVETGLKRADYIGDLVALCEVFGIAVGELLAGDGSAKITPSSERSLLDIRLALLGEGPQPDDVLGQIRDEYEVDRIVKLANLEDEGQLRMITYVLFDRLNFLELRDERAGVNVRPGNRASIRSRRAAATKMLLSEIALSVEQQGVDALVQGGVRKAQARALDLDESGNPNPEKEKS